MPALRARADALVCFTQLVKVECLPPQLLVDVLGYDALYADLSELHTHARAHHYCSGPACRAVYSTEQSLSAAVAASAGARASIDTRCATCTFARSVDRLCALPNRRVRLWQTGTGCRSACCMPCAMWHILQLACCKNN